MDISAACTPPKQPAVRAADRAHPLFPIYSQHRASCSVHLVEASDFRSWLGQYEHGLLTERWAEHERYPEFMGWMLAHQGGARRCPAGIFPHNFCFWLEGGRW